MVTKFLLALDAGHGLPTPGRRIPANLDPSQHQEWWLNQRICNYIAEAAKRYEGFEILRVDDATGAEDVGMSVRCQRPTPLALISTIVPTTMLASMGAVAAA